MGVRQMLAVAGAAVLVATPSGGGTALASVPLWTSPSTPGLAGPVTADGLLAAGGGITADGAELHGDLGRQVLARNDGWAAAAGGTTGGSAADPAHVFTAHNRAELVAALGGAAGTDATPKIVYLTGTIPLSVDDDNTPLDCADYATDGYTLDAYLAAYDPATWGWTQRPSGPLEQARAASAGRQDQRIKIKVPPNTTIVGTGPGARVLGGGLYLTGVSNVIIRNVGFENAMDCFPQWDPLDNSPDQPPGNWNSGVSPIVLDGATHVWVDHDSFTDGDYPDRDEPVYFGRRFQQHDGQVDIVKASDLVTVSWNKFTAHDKSMLIGHSDAATTDLGKLRVTVHHNAFANVLERTPRVRFGQVHVYDNYYHLTAGSGWLYSLGVGVSSALYAENNYYRLGTGLSAGDIIFNWGGTAVHSSGDLVNGVPTDLLAAHNATHDPDLGGDVGWRPTFVRHLDPTAAVPDLALAHAGASRTLTVSATGAADVRTVQAAIDAVPVNNAQNTTVHIAPGNYREVVNIPADKPYLHLVGGSRRAADTTVVFDNFSGTPKPGGGTLGTAGSATVTIAADNVRASFLTFANDFDEAAHPETTQQQAVALLANADRLVFDHDRFLGDQDTLYAATPGGFSTAGTVRQLYTDSYVEGTVDFVFGRASAVFAYDTLHAKNRVDAKVTAAATPPQQRYGFLIVDSRITSDAPPKSIRLGRPWVPSSNPDYRAQVTVRDSWLDDAVSDSPWQDWSSPPLPWQQARFAEYHNRGPGAGTGADRPQLTDEQAVDQTAADYLRGEDSWTPLPVRRRYWPDNSHQACHTW